MVVLGNEWSLARPTKAQYEWQDYEIGMFIHWFPWVGLTDNGVLKDKSELLDENKQIEFAQTLKMDKMNTDQWVQSAVDMGAKYIVFVAKHNVGFCRWQTDADTPFSMKNAGYKNGQGDIVRELSDSCRKFGIKFGIYMCGDSLTYDAGHGGVVVAPERQKAYETAYDNGEVTDVSYWADSERHDKYVKMYRQWLTELVSRYGELAEIWFDSSLKIDVSDIIAKYAPNAMIFQSSNATIRWVGNEEGWAYYPAWNAINRYDALTGTSFQKHSDPDGDVWMPLECDVPIRTDWSYNPSPSNKLISLDKLIEMYYKSVGRGTTLLLNQGPHCDGYIIEEDFNRVREFGDEIRRRFSNHIAQTSGEGEFVEIYLGKMQPVDHVVTMEDIRYGQRIRKYVIEGFDGEKWIKLANGSAIGHKKIDFFPEVNVSKVRFKGLVSVGQPLIRSMKVYHVGTIPEGFTNNEEE